MADLERRPARRRTRDIIISTEAADLYRRLAAGGHAAPEDAHAMSQLRNLQLVRHDPATGASTLEDPGYLGARLLADFHDEAARQLDRAAEVGAAFEALRTAYAARSAAVGDGTVEYLTGWPMINARLGQVLAGCTESLDASQPGGPRKPELLATVKERDLAVLGRGVQMRTIYAEDARAGEGMHEWVTEMTAAGAQIRTLDAEFPRMIIIDRRVAVIPGDDDRIARIIHDPGVAGFLVDRLFGCHWSRATPWVGVGDPVQSLTDARYERVLALLEKGMGHKEIGTALQIKPRRLAEIIAELKVMYGVESLFQLGYRWREEKERRAHSVSQSSAAVS
jgi:hypothetical protein